MIASAYGEDMLNSEQTMWRVEAPSGRSVTCHVARLPTTDYELRIVYAGQVLAYEVYSDLRHAVQRGTAVKDRMVEFVNRAAES
jgi:hypothetical protein